MLTRSSKGLVPTVIVYAVNHGFTRADEYYSGGLTSTVVLGTRSGVVASGSETGSSLSTLSAPHRRHNVDVEKLSFSAPNA